MIEETDEQMQEWARTVVPRVNVTVAAPPPDGKAAGIYLTLLAIAPVPAPRGMKRPPLELALDYLVSTAGDDVPKAHGWLGTLAFAALDVASWKIVAHPVPLELWRSFGVAPRPAFVVRVPLRLDRPTERVPLVREPPVLEMLPIAHLAGEVVGPGDRPIAGASVEVSALQLFGRTDENGAFQFPMIPADTPMWVVVRTKGQTLRLQSRPGQRLRVELNEKELEE